MFNTPQSVGWATNEEAQVANEMRENMDKFVKSSDVPAKSEPVKVESNNAGVNVTIEEDDDID